MYYIHVDCRYFIHLDTLNAIWYQVRNEIGYATQYTSVHDYKKCTCTQTRDGKIEHLG